MGLQIYGIEKQQEYLRNQAKHRRDAAAQVNRVKEVIQSFDGKQYNKRFDDAISELSTDDVRFYVSNQYGWFYIQCYPRHNGFNSYSNTRSLVTGYSCIKSDQYERYRTEDKNKLFEGKKILADKMLEAANESRAKLLKEAFELEQAADNLETTLTQIASLKAALEHITKSLPSEAIDACNLKRYY